MVERLLSVKLLDFAEGGFVDRRSMGVTLAPLERRVVWFLNITKMAFSVGMQLLQRPTFTLEVKLVLRV